MTYGTSAGFTAYHNARFNDIAAMSAGDIDVALQVGSDYVDGRGMGYFVGTRADGYNQSREWPRRNAFDLSGTPIPATLVPLGVEYAAYEAGLANFNAPGLLTPTVTTADRKVLTGVDVIRWSVIGKDTPDALRPVLTRVHDLLAPFIDELDHRRKVFLGVV